MKVNTDRAEMIKLKHKLIRIVKISALSCVMLMMQRTYINAQSNYMILVEQALTAVKHDSLLHAEKLYKQALDAEPTNYTNTLIFTNLIRLQESQMKFTDAIETCNQALEQFPNSEVFLSMRGNIFFRMKQYARALQDYEQVLSRHPGEYRLCWGSAEHEWKWDKWTRHII